MDIPAFIAIPIRAIFLIGFLVYMAIWGAYALVATAAIWFWQTVTEG